MIGELLERNKNEENKKYSIIHWHTGEPKKGGRYLIQTKYDSFQFDIYSSFIQQWATYTKKEVIAWCDLNDIEPYKEEKK